LPRLRDLRRLKIAAERAPCQSGISKSNLVNVIEI